LFLTLLALLAMSLAAVALIRSVDTSAMIAGNLAFKQLATNAASNEIETAINWLATTQITNNGKQVGKDPSHTFNTDVAGYLSFIDTRDLTIQSVWTPIASPEIPDAGGNRSSYVIQRMCRDDATPIEYQSTKCLYGADAQEGGKSQGITGSEDSCDPGTCGDPTSFPLYRITVRTIGLKNSISYVQAFAY
jgi:type IV pilus assembly protein PilX